MVFAAAFQLRSKKVEQLAEHYSGFARNWYVVNHTYAHGSPGIAFANTMAIAQSSMSSASGAGGGASAGGGGAGGGGGGAG